MSRSLNRVQLIGHLGKDAEVKYTQAGVSVASFSIATSRRWQDKATQEWKEETDWHRCVFWRCENVANYLRKGKQIYLSGRLQTRSWDDAEGVTRYVTEVVCEDMILLGGGERAPHPAAEDARPAAGPAPAGEMGVGEDDVPF